MLFRRCLSCISVVALALAATAGRSVAQEQNVNVDPLLEQMRADLRADKVAIVTEAMKLTPAEADKFWPVYRKYEAEVVKLNDERIKLLKDYDDNYTTLTNTQAKALAEKYFDWESRRTQLRKKYFDEFMKATSAITAAKFFQVEHRIDLLVDLQIAADLPGLFMKSTASGK